jgi:hypothetical protein
MSDFSELCPLFNTGVFHEIIFPGPIELSSIGTLKDLLAGTAAGSAGYSSGFSFGRTVIVTEAFIQRGSLTNDTETSLYLKHKTSGTQALGGTIIGTLTLPVSASAHQPPGWKAFPAFTGKTFSSNEVLALAVLSNANDSGYVGLMVRYKDK